MTFESLSVSVILTRDVLKTRLQVLTLKESGSDRDMIVENLFSKLSLARISLQL